MRFVYGLMGRVREWCRWRKGFGPPAGDMMQTLYIDSSWERGQLGLSVGWVFGAGGRRVELMLGPLFVMVSWPPTKRALRREREGKPDLAWFGSHETDRTVGGRQFTTFLRLQHLGASVRWGRRPGGPVVIVRVGPAGAAVEPAYEDGGYLSPRCSTVVNDTGRSEPVLTRDQWLDINLA